MSNQYKDSTPQEIDQAVQKAWEAFSIYRKISLKQRAEFMRAIATELEDGSKALIEAAAKETHLPEARLRSELGRTAFQLRNYADATAEAWWIEARIDTADSNRTPPKPDVRKMLLPLGPVAVFGASNFPFAYSTAGGDTACAFAAGCPVIVKAHPAHPETSELQAKAIRAAIKKQGLPEGVFGHVYGGGVETGKALVLHRYIKAVGFTGSYQGGRALFDWANQRDEPIPVFAEMGSINPVFLLPAKMRRQAEEVATLYAASITQGVGQFCTNPGLLIAVESEELQQFMNLLAQKLSEVKSAPMLHEGIAKSYLQKRREALEQDGVSALTEIAEEEGSPLLASASGEAFLNNPILHKEVFGPYSLVIRCKDKEEMRIVAKHCEGQLTATVMADEEELNEYADLLELITNICGRMVFNSVPTGVEVCAAMHHGGPFPASTDSRFTSVGSDAIKRFARPLSYQNWPEHLLPQELQSGNPLGIWRLVNNVFTKEASGK